MHSIEVTQLGTRTTLLVNGKLILVTSNANIARAYAAEAELHYASSSEPFRITPRSPEKSV